MLQIISISKARSNLSKLIQKIKETKEPVVIVKGSDPSVVIYPYDEIIKKDEEKERLFQLRFQKILRDGEKTFKKYLEEKGINKPATEEEAYSIIKNA